MEIIRLFFSFSRPLGKGYLVSFCEGKVFLGGLNTPVEDACATLNWGQKTSSSEVRVYDCSSLISPFPLEGFDITLPDLRDE